MGKKFTTFVVLLAAVLFTLPTQAQIVKKAAPTGAMKTTVVSADQLKAGKAAYEKANDKTVGIAFRGNAAVAESSVQLTAEELKAMKAADKSVGKIFAKWDWAAHQAKYFNKKNLAQSSFKNRFSDFTPRKVDPFEGKSVKVGNVAGPRRATTTDEHGIITDPGEGETKYYTRAGMAFYNGGYSVYTDEQSGTVTIVEAEGGKVYIKDPVSHYSQGSWVEGTKDGNTITVAAGQPLAWNTNYSTTLGLYWGNVQSSSSGNTYIKDEANITFTVDDEAGTVTLDGSSADKIIAVFWDDDNSWSGYGDYSTVWTLNAEYEPASTDPIVLPDGAEVQNWYADGTGSAAVPTDVKVAFVGNEVYISGLTSNFPDAWIKGTLDGTTVTFSKFQFVGMYSPTMPVWAVGADSQTGALQDFTMTYDAEAQTLTLDENQLLVFNAAEDRMYYLSYIESLTIYAEKPAPKQIDELPYVNSFDTTDDQKQFTIIDANEDGRTWNWYNGMARYTYNSTNQGDDWLVSPAIKLVAGKKYHFSIGAHAQSANYPERIEVKAAKENTAEALAAGTEVLPSTDVTTPGFVTFENNEFTVAESGYYYIGVHAISDADKYYLYVDDFLLEAAPITAPYVADFTTDGPFGDFVALDANDDATSNGNGTWNWSATNYAYYKYSSTNAADDYLILPIQLAAGKAYNVTVNAASNGSFYPEKFEVVWGTEPTKEAMTNVIIAETTLSSDVFADHTGSFTTTEAGTYYVAIHAISDADQFNLKVKSFAIEVGAAGTAPAAVTDLVVTPTEDKIETTIVFNAPTTSVDGNELTENLTNIDVLRDGVVIESVADVAPGSERTIVDNEEKGLTLGTHKYQVIPYNADGIGQKSEEVSVKIVTSINVPYTVDFKQEGVIDNFTVIDANNDGKTWNWTASNGAYNTYSSTLNADDYLVTLPINMVEGTKYNITAVMSAYSASYPEKFEVKVAAEATAEALAAANAVIPATEVTVDPAEYTGQFTAPATGKYFVAIHAISDKDSWYLLANSLSVEAAPSENAPAAVGDFTVTPGAEGALEVNLSFNIPYNAINGESLANPVDAKIYRDGVLVNTITNASLGSNQTWKDTNVENRKNYTYWVVCSDATNGDGVKSEKKSAFVGEDYLADMEGIYVKATTATSATFAWEQVQGVNGGYINQSGVTYKLMSLAIESTIFGNYLVEDQELASTSDLTATIDINLDEGEMEYRYFGVKAVKGEEATDATYDYAYLVLGAPEELPIVEGFANNTLHYGWDTNGGLGIDTESSDGDGTALKLYNDGTSSEVYFALNKVNLKNVGNPTLIFDVKSPMITSVSGIGSVDDNSTEVLSNATVTSEYTTVKVPLTSLNNHTRFATVGIQATIPTASLEQYEDYIIIDNIRIMDLYEHDLAVSVKAPKNINAGENAPIKVTVENQGENAANGFTLVIKAGDKELFNKTVNEALPAFKKTEYDATLETTTFDDTQDITVSAEVIYENDLNLDNNKAETIVSVKGSTLAQPENVKAVQNADETVKVSWTAPSTEAATEITDDVESYEEFDCGGLNEEVHTGNIGNWTVYDGNGTYCYGFNGITIPNLGDKNAWLVMAPASEQLSQDLSVNYPAHSGDQYFISACCAEPEGAVAATDHWLISPELPGVEQTISFFARELTTDYGAETYEVLASSTDAQPASFTKVSEGSIDATEWTEVTAQLPAGTKYFAIRHTSTDVFGLMVDDITYLGGASAAESFNIYVNGEKIANVAGDKTEYIVTPDKFAAGEQEFAVSAVYANGESKPVAVKLTVVTGIKQIADGNKTFDVYTLDGKLVRQQAKSLEGLKGVYVINGKAVMVK